MTKSQEIIAEIKAEIPKYIKQIGEFYVKNMQGEHHLICHYTAKEYHTCAACGNPKIKEIFVVANRKGEQFEIGNVCILSIGNENILYRFKSMEQKLENITKNAKAIDILDGFLNAIENDTSPIWVSKQGIKRLTDMQERMCDGLNPLKSQWRLFYSYMKKIAEAC